MSSTVCCLLVAGLATAAAVAQESGNPPLEVSESIQVTATRVPEDVLDVPASITVIAGSELEERGVTDLASALALAGGVAVAPGGDAGPASSIPELMGLREFDAYLLVVDGVPWGGAFNPAASTLDLTNVERIEVLRGPAPVLFGATSFVGVIHVIHKSPAETPTEVSASVGNHDSFGAAVRSQLPGSSSFQQSISSSFERQGYADPNTGFDRGHALWSAVRGAPDAGQLRFSADATLLRQDPASPRPRVGGELSPLVPLDSNQNPSDARIDENRFAFTTGYDRRFASVDWLSTVSLAHTRRDRTQGFLRPDFVVPDGVSNADGFRQHFTGDDLYVDTHVAWKPSTALSLVTGVDLLAGKGAADSNNFEYHVDPTGAGAPSSRGIQIDERPALEDQRRFAGLYAQALWKPGTRWLVDAGLRLNQTHEKESGEVAPGNSGEPVDEPPAVDSRDETRLSGGLGLSYLAWSADDQAIWLYGEYTDAFKPAAVDFGPEAEGEILKPETAQTVEAGLKGTHLAGRLTWQASVFRMDFENLVVATAVNGLPALANGGQQRFEGVELEGRYRLTGELTLAGSFASHSAKFRDYVAEFDGVPTQLRGNRLEMSPDELAALSLVYAPERGFTAYATGNHVGSRYLDKRNHVLADAYGTLAAGIGYRFERFELRLDGDNLTDQRPPVAESELGDAQYYVLPARSIEASVRVRFGGEARR